ncbi:Trigger factor [Sedimentisphaera cyanobacteriorum]|uniref:Trigger factor n=1 Tax=Sedimentisphaera cyanobacteriorum TaxID=1940790 RepID=A0A1Q2HMH1_9BACT|nr:trigger factor [Sedimentisphaera cyanobacteriorum]AQQ08719.1 Trigger factor [Sedimentisphaera cyanobacteriorum]
MTEETANKLDINVTTEKVGPCRMKVTIEVPEETIKKVFSEQYSDLQKEVVLPGFRRGRAPRRLIQKRFGTEIEEQAKLKILSDCTQQALEEENLDTLGEPDIDHEKLELPEEGSFSYDIKVNIRPEIELPEIEGIEIEKPVHKMDENFVDNQLEQIQKRFAEWVDRDENEAIEKDDQIIADIEITPDGEEPVTAEDSELFVSSGQGFAGKVPVEDLDKLLEGKKIGDEAETETQVPEDFFNDQFKGKKCRVKIEIKEIKYQKMPDLNDEFAEKIGMESMDQLKERIIEYGKQDAERRTNSALHENVRNYLLENCDFELPEDIVSEQADSVMKREYSRLMMQGYGEEELKRQLEQIQARSKDNAKNMLKSVFIMNAIADKYDIKVTPEEINGYIAQTAAQQQRRPEKVREELAKDGSLQEFNMQAREQKCLEKIIEKANIKEVSPEENEDEKQQDSNQDDAE